MEAPSVCGSDQSGGRTGVGPTGHDEFTGIGPSMMLQPPLNPGPATRKSISQASQPTSPTHNAPSRGSKAILQGLRKP